MERLGPRKQVWKTRSLGRRRTPCIWSTRTPFTWATETSSMWKRNARFVASNIEPIKLEGLTVLNNTFCDPWIIRTLGVPSRVFYQIAFSHCFWLFLAISGYFWLFLTISDWTTDRPTDRQTDRKTDRQAEWPTDRPTAWPLDRLI